MLTELNSALGSGLRAHSAQTAEWNAPTNMKKG